MHDGGNVSGHGGADSAMTHEITNLRDELRRINALPMDSAERFDLLRDVSAKLDRIMQRHQIDAARAAARVIDLDGKRTLYLATIPPDETIANLLKHWGRRIQILAQKQLSQEP